MRADAGQLLYGIEINSNDFKRLNELDDFKYPSWDLTNEAYKVEKIRLEEIQKDILVEIDHPYETGDYYLAIKDSNKSCENGGMSLGKHIITNPEWDKILKKACEKYDLTYQDPTWHLIGHYV